MGADQIFVYHSPIGENATNALESLPGLITPIEFSMPQALADIHYHGQIAVINDCLYRTTGRFKWTGFFDIDEYPTPRQHLTWRELFDSYDEQKEGYCFTNTFVCPGCAYEQPNYSVDTARTRDFWNDLDSVPLILRSPVRQATIWY